MDFRDITKILPCLGSPAIGTCLNLDGLVSFRYRLLLLLQGGAAMSPEVSSRAREGAEICVRAALAVNTNQTDKNYRDGEEQGGTRWWVTSKRQLSN